MAEEKEVKTQTQETKKTGIPKVLIVIGLVLIVLVVASNFIYKKVAERAAEGILSGVTGGKVNVEKGGDKISIKTEEGELSFQEGGKLPANFPKDFPIYPEAKLTSSFTAGGDEAKGASVVWETADPVAKVGTYYKEELPKAGWEISSVYEQDDSLTFTFAKGDVSGFGGIAAADGKTTISITIGK